MNKAEIKNDKKKTAKVVFNVIFYVVMAVIISTLIYGLVLKSKGSQSFYVFGYRAMIVSSSSMSTKFPAYEEFLEGHDEQMQVGDLVITRKIRPEDELEVYDIVTFVDSLDRTVIHRIVETGYVGTIKVYRTRGDATNTLDAARARSQYEDIYVTNIKWIGKLIRFLQEPVGIVAMVIALAFLFLIYILIKMLMKFYREKHAPEVPLIPPDEKVKRKKAIVKEENTVESSNENIEEDIPPNNITE